MAFPKDKTQWDGIVGPNTWSKLCNNVPTIKTKLSYDAQNDACGKTSFKLGGSEFVKSNLGIQNSGALVQDSYGNLWIQSSYSDGHNYVQNYVVVNPTTGKTINTFNFSSQLSIFSFSAYGLTSDGKGHMWFLGEDSNSLINTLFEVDAKTGNLIHAYGSQDLSTTQSMNVSFDIDASGNVWVFRSGLLNTQTYTYDSSGASIYEITNGKVSTFVDGSTGNIPSSTYAADIYSDIAGNVYVMFYQDDTDNTISTFDKFTNHNLISTCNSNDYQSSATGIFEDSITSLNSSYDQSYGLSVGAISFEDLGSVFNTNNTGLCNETTFAQPSYSLYNPTAATLDNNGYIWITSTGSLITKGYNGVNTGNISPSLSEINPAGGKLIKLLNDSSFKFTDPTGVAYDPSGYIWVVNSATYNSDYTKLVSGGTLVKINAITGKLVNIYQ